MYDPSVGRWLREDPIGFEAGDADLYRYVGNAPTNATDPTGLDPYGGLGPAYYQNTGRVKRAAQEGRNKGVASYIDDLPNGTKEEKEKAKAILLQYVNAADFYWEKPCGFFGKCYLWVDEYEKKTRHLATSRKETQKFFKVDTQAWDNNYARWLGAGHIAIRITMADGIVFYLDDGNLGGIDNLFYPSEIPSHYVPYTP